jgi:hypothetical protein
MFCSPQQMSFTFSTILTRNIQVAVNKHVRVFCGETRDKEQPRSVRCERGNNIEISLNRLTSEFNPYAQRCLTKFFTGILLLETCILLIYA